MIFKILIPVLRVFVKLFFRVRVVGEENIPKDGGCIICANHFSNWDPVFMLALITRRIYFMAKAELFKVPVLGALIRHIGMIPVNRTGSDLAAIRASIKVLNEGKALGIFPSGKRVKKGEESSAKSGVVFLAVKAAVSAVPVYIDTTYRIFSKVTIHIGKPEDFSVYNKAKLSSEQLTELSEGLFKNIYALSEVE